MQSLLIKQSQWKGLCPVSMLQSRTFALCRKAADSLQRSDTPHITLRNACSLLIGELEH